MRYFGFKSLLITPPRWIPLRSSRQKKKSTGEVQVKFGLVLPGVPRATKAELQTAWESFISSLERDNTRGIRAVIDAPATESVADGMIRVDTDDMDALGQ